MLWADFRISTSAFLDIGMTIYKVSDILRNNSCIEGMQPHANKGSGFAYRPSGDSAGKDSQKMTNDRFENPI